MYSNLKRLDQALRIIGGVVLTAFGILYDNWLGLVGLPLILTGASGHCVIYRLAGINRDLQQRNFYLALLPNTDPNPAAIFGRDGATLFANDAFTRYFGQIPGLDKLDGVKMETVKRLCAKEEKRAAFISDAGPRAFQFILQEECKHDCILAHGSEVTDLLRLKEDKIREAKLAAVGKVTAGIIHEIRTPLTSMLVTSQLLEEETVRLADPQLEQEFGQMARAISNGSTRINNIIRAMEGLAARGDKMEKTLSSLYDTLVFTLRILHSRAKFVAAVHLEGAPFSMELPGDPERLKMKIAPQLMEQVWVILLNNALDAFEGGDVPFDDRRIDIDIFREEGQTVIRVRDTAGGIPETVLPRIFEPFYTTKEGKGMGLGLDVAREIVEAHGGTISARNGMEGALFQVALPEKGESTR